MSPTGPLDVRLDPLIHEAARLVIVSVLSECEVANFNFLLSPTGLTRGHLSTHMRKLVEAGYSEETKAVVDRKLRTEYRLSRAGRHAFVTYRSAWQAITNGYQANSPSSARE